MPSFPIVDAHVHLYDPGAVRFPWMVSEPVLDAPHGLPEFSHATASVDVEAFVFVEVDAAEGAHLEEARWVEAHAGADPRCSGIVGSMPVERGADAIAADLETFASLPRARGVRRLIQDRPPGFAARPAFVAGVRSLARFDLPFDVCVRQGQLAEALQLVRLCPDIRFVLDHLGKPAIREGRLDPWRGLLRDLAREPNVWCKVSGLATEADHRAWRQEDVAPCIEHALECFGYERAMFGGDWPVATLATPYARWVETVDYVARDADDNQRRALFRDTAKGFYGL